MEPNILNQDGNRVQVTGAGCIPIGHSRALKAITIYHGSNDLPLRHNIIKPVVIVL